MVRFGWGWGGDWGWGWGWGWGGGGGGGVLCFSDCLVLVMCLCLYHRVPLCVCGVFHSQPYLPTVQRLLEVALAMQAGEALLMRHPQTPPRPPPPTPTHQARSAAGTSSRRTPPSASSSITPTWTRSSSCASSGPRCTRPGAGRRLRRGRRSRARTRVGGGSFAGGVGWLCLGGV